MDFFGEVKIEWGGIMIKRVITAVAVALVLSSGAYAQSKIPNVCKGINLREHLPMPPYKVLLEKERFGMCEMILWMDGNFVPVFATKNFVMSGDMWSHKKQISERDIWLAKKKFFTLKKIQKLLKSMTAYTINPKAKRYVYLVISPTDSYCNEVESKIKDLAKKHNFGVRVVFYVPSIHALGVSGVPVIITDKGDYIVGYQPSVLLKDLGVKNAGN